MFSTGDKDAVRIFQHHFSDSEGKLKSSEENQEVMGGNQTALDIFHYLKKRKNKQICHQKFTVQCVRVFNLTIQQFGGEGVKDKNIKWNRGM